MRIAVCAIILAGILVLSGGTRADTPLVSVSNAWARETPAGAPTAAGFVTILSARDERVTGISSPRAEKVEIHEMAMEGDVMKMRALTEGLALKGGQAFEMTPENGVHLMFIKIDAAFKDGEAVPVTFTFENAAPLTVDISVRAAADDHSHHHH